jgi:hypothetical protein
MNETQWPHTLYLTQNRKKLYVPVFKPESPVCPVMAIFQKMNVPILKPDVLVSTG